MQRLCSFIAFILCTSLGYAQVSIPAASQQILAATDVDQLSLVVKVTGAFEVENLKVLGAHVGSRVGDIITLRIASDKIEELKMLEGLAYLQVAHKITPNLKRAAEDLRSNAVYNGVDLNQGYTGKDVIIGITDWGFDYTHPMFYDTALQHTRILAAWDQFKTSGPAPMGYDYGTEYEGEEELLAAEKDTINIYGYATHGSHVAGIAGGSGAGTIHRGVAYEANFLMATFLVDEAAVIDAFVWMKNKAAAYNKRLVINMSWGLYNLGPLDGTSLVSQAINNLSDEGVIFVTSGGNNGDVNYHIKKSFANDTMQSRISFYNYSAHPNMWGQSISMWGEEGEDFSAGFSILSNQVLQTQTDFFSTSTDVGYHDSFLVTGTDTIFYNVQVDGPHPLNNKPHIRLRIKNTNTSLVTALKAEAASGTVHFYNVVELTTDVGNWGQNFSAYLPGWERGDEQYSLGEPASTESVITVAAHSSEITNSLGTTFNGSIASFSSYGPTVDERMKPDVSAPGVNVASSISSFTNRGYTLLENVSFNGKEYPFARFSGTSMSSPATAGVVALMLQANPNLYYDEAKTILRNTAREDDKTGDLSESGDVQWGWGKVDAHEAVKASEVKFLRVDVLTQDIGMLFPNPVSDKLYVSVTNAAEVNVYSLEGKRVLSGEVSESNALDVSELQAGMYLLRFVNGNVAPVRFVVE